MTEIPALPTLCWPIDPGCCDGWDDYSDEVKARAEALATQTIYILAGRRVGGCPIIVRPCKTSCVASSGAWYWSDGTFMPYMMAGSWLNATCGCTSSCSCSQLEEVLLTGPVGDVYEVKVDGAILDPAAYRVDNGNILVRVDGGTWPICQNMSLPDTEPDTFSVAYLNAYPVDGLGAYVAGRLACEFAKACSGGKCALPSGVVSIVRQGVQMTLPGGSFPDGLTGIREVDAYIEGWNPHHIKSTPTVWYPGMKTARTSRQPSGMGIPPEFDTVDGGTL